LDNSGGEIVGRLLIAVVGIVGVACGVLAGILFAPRKGSETREEIVKRSRPLQESARKAASRAREKIAPIARMAGSKIPLSVKPGSAFAADVPAAEADGDNQPFGEERGNGTTNGHHAMPNRVGVDS
jgi:hypothetical protein